MTGEVAITPHLGAAPLQVWQTGFRIFCGDVDFCTASNNNGDAGERVRGRYRRSAAWKMVIIRPPRRACGRGLISAENNKAER